MTPPRQIYASSATRRDRRWGRPRYALRAWVWTAVAAAAVVLAELLSRA